MNNEIRLVNKKLKHFCNKFKNVKLLDISDFERKYFTRHGLHLNKLGKVKIVNNSNACLNDLWYLETFLIILVIP